MTLLDTLRAAGRTLIDAHRQVQRAQHGVDPVQAARLAGLIPVREGCGERGPEGAPELSPLEQQRQQINASLVPATPANVALALNGPAPDPERVAAAEAADRDRRAREEADRLRRTRVRVEIDLSAEQWLLLVKHGHDPLLPPNGTRSTEPRVVHGMILGWVEDRAALYPGATRPVYEPLRSGVCELEGVEIDGHEPSDLDPLGGCMWCGKQEIYGVDDDGLPIRFDFPVDRDERDRLDS